MAGILKNLECCSITVGGHSEHIHILCNLSKKYATIKVLEIVKKESSRWVKDQESGAQTFHWQDGYGLFSVSPSHLEAVRQYIIKQEEHHQQVSYQEELLGILRKNKVSYDERYLWDWLVCCSALTGQEEIVGLGPGALPSATMFQPFQAVDIPLTVERMLSLGLKNKLCCPYGAGGNRESGT
jgi:REP-associated tyrosine transposase